MFYLVILLNFITFSAQAMENSVVVPWSFEENNARHLSARTMDKEPITLWTIHEIALEPSTPTWLPTRFSPKYYEEKLISAVEKNTNYQNSEAAKHPSKRLPVGMRAWLLDLETETTMPPLARENISGWTEPILYKVASAAFSPSEASSYLTPLPEIIALVKACQQRCQTVLTSNWNSASFAQIETDHTDVISLFELRFTSGIPGNPGSSTKLQNLSTEPAFFEKIKEALGHDHPYYFIGTEEDTESLVAAEDAGVTPIAVPMTNNKEKALALKVQLVKYGLLPE